MINAVTVRELLSYNPETGVFTWNQSVSTQVNRGDVAGHVESNRYRRIQISGVRYLAHRLAWLVSHGEFPPDEIDHINGVRDDNRLSNIRLATKTQNQRNKALGRQNKLGVFGVRWKANGFEAFIKLAGKNVYLGRYGNIFDAACARKTAEIEHGFDANHGAR